MRSAARCVNGVTSSSRQHVRRRLDDRQRRAQFVTCVARERALALDEFLEARGESVQRVGEALDIAVGAHGQVFRQQRIEIRPLGIPVAHRVGERDHRRERAPRRAIGHPCRQVDDHDDQAAQRHAEKQHEAVRARRVEGEIKPSGRRIGHVDDVRPLAVRAVVAEAETAKRRRHVGVLASGLLEKAAHEVGVRRLRCRIACDEVDEIIRIVLEDALDEHVLDHRRRRVHADHRGETDGGHLQDERHPDLAAQAAGARHRYLAAFLLRRRSLRRWYVPA